MPKVHVLGAYTASLMDWARKPHIWPPPLGSVALISASPRSVKRWDGIRTFLLSPIWSSYDEGSKFLQGATKLPWTVHRIWPWECLQQERKESLAKYLHGSVLASRNDRAHHCQMQVLGLVIIALRSSVDSWLPTFSSLFADPSKFFKGKDTLFYSQFKSTNKRHSWSQRIQEENLCYNCK